jgi:hypothetical protein
MIYFPFESVPVSKELDLFKILPNGVAIGTLVQHLPGFINLILTCPNEYLEILYKGGSVITEMISQDQVLVNPLHVFVKDCLFKDEDNIIKLGGKSTSGEETLYGVYSS